MDTNLDRRRFLAGSTLAGAGLTLAATRADAHAALDKPALLGGQPVRTTDFPAWPISGEKEEAGLLRALRSGRWGRGGGAAIKEFEETYARTMRSKYCLATSSGTGALTTALSAVGVEAGDEVILTPYTFVACANAILERHALPVFVDVDLETFQMDAGKVEAAITDRTTAIMPVHIGGSPVDMDALMPIARKHKIPIVEDACQAHLAQWRGRHLGTLTETGCFSFQSSKHLNSGEGGAILTNDDQLYEKCFAFHYNGMRAPNSRKSAVELKSACKFMISEFQAAVLLGQLSRLEEQSARRGDNAAYLTKQLSEIPGILPARLHDGCTRSAYHLYMFRYQPEMFSQLPRSAFIKALSAEGVSASAGYSPLNTQPFLKATLQSRGFGRLYSKERLVRWEEQNVCPQNEKLCEQAVWLTQRQLLGTHSDIDQIASAVRKLHRYAAELAKA